MSSSTPADWQRCEGEAHEGDERDSTVEWRELGLLCDACDAAIGDTRRMRAALQVALAYISADIDSDDDAYSVCQQIREALGGGQA